MRTVQQWEQGLREPDGAAKTLLRIIKREPDAAHRALGSPADPSLYRQRIRDFAAFVQHLLPQRVTYEERPHDPQAWRHGAARDDVP